MTGGPRGSAWRDGGWIAEARAHIARRLPALLALLALALLPASLVAPVGGSLILYERPPLGDWAPYGIVTYQDEMRVRVVAVWGREAAAAGLKRGDTIVAVDRRPIPSRGYRRQLLAPKGGAILVHVGSGLRGTRSLTLPRRETAARPVYDRAFGRLGLSERAVRILELLLQLLPAAFLSAGAFLLLRKRSGWVPSLLCLSFLLIGATTVPVAALFWGEYQLNRLSGPLGHAGWGLLAISLLAFPSGRFRPRWTGWAAVAIVGWFASLAFLPHSEPLKLIGYVLMLPLCLIALRQRYVRLGAGQERQQLRWLVLGFGAGGIAIACARILLFLWDRLILWDPVFLVAMPLLGHALVGIGTGLFATGLLVAVRRYRLLYDAEAWLSRSAVFALLTLLLVAAFAAGVKGVELVVEGEFGHEAGALPAIVGAAFAALLLTPLHNRLRAWAEARFQKRLTGLRRDLPARLADLRHICGTGELLDEAQMRLCEGVQASHAAVILAGRPAGARAIAATTVAGWLDAGHLRRADGSSPSTARDPLFPLRVPLRIHSGAAPEGWLLLGPRPDGSLYSKDEMLAVEEIAGPLAVALRIAAAREATEARRETRLAAIEAELARLRGNMADPAPPRPDFRRPSSRPGLIARFRLWLGLGR